MLKKATMSKKVNRTREQFQYDLVDKRLRNFEQDQSFSSYPKHSILNDNMDSSSTGEDKFGNELSKLCGSFCSEARKIMKSKRKCLGNFAKDYVKKSKQRVLETETMQLEKREKLVEEFKSEFYSVIQLAVSELDKIKDVEDKVKNLLELKETKKRKQKDVCSKQLEELKKLNDEFGKGIQDLDEHHKKQYTSVLKDIKREMNRLQKKILAETQEREMENVRKHLKMSF